MHSEKGIEKGIEKSIEKGVEKGVKYEELIIMVVAEVPSQNRYLRHRAAVNIDKNCYWLYNDGEKRSTALSG